MAGFNGREKALVSTLAGGWQQRLARLRSSSSAADPVPGRAKPRVSIRNHGDGFGISSTPSRTASPSSVSTHYMDEAEYCNRAALINQGRLIAVGSPRRTQAHRARRRTSFARRRKPRADARRAEPTRRTFSIAPCWATRSTSWLDATWASCPHFSSKRPAADRARTYSSVA